MIQQHAHNESGFESDTLSSFIPGYRHAPRDLGDVLILGLGKSGRAACEYCAVLLGTRIRSLTIAGGDDNEASRAFVASLDSDEISVSFDTYDFDDRYQLCIASPGIPQTSEFYRNAQRSSDELISEVEFAWRESREDSRWMAITGTNGKTTTTALTTHLLGKAGYRADSVGNIGSTCIDAVAADNIDIYVAEVSSYQLASTTLFAPDVAVLLNITPDHVSWHGSHQAYVDAKLAMFDHLRDAKNRSAYAILDATNDEVRALVKRIKELPKSERGYAYIPLGAAAGLATDMRQACGSENAAFLDRGRLRVCVSGDEYSFGTVDDLQIKGEHNGANALAAASAVLALGIDPTGVAENLATFAPLEHRLEPCGSIEGVRCYNDSKATNVDATLKALSAFGDVKPIVLLGGSDKGTSLDALVDAADRSAQAVVCYGAAGPRFEQAFAGAGIRVESARKLEEALDRALEISSVGDVVVLSPACASFDEFSSFEHRGRVFKELVTLRSRERGV